MTSSRLSLTQITKRYPAVVANDAVSLTVQPGEIHAVLGENGAGKSTLMKIIYGAVQPDGGEMRFNGEVVRIRNPQEARRLGISMVFQHFSLFDTLSVAENVWLGLDKSLTLAQVTQRITETASQYGLDIDPARPVHTLSVGEMQRKLEAQKAANIANQQANDRMASEVRDLREGLEMVEEKARTELGMVKPNEIYVQVAAPAASAQATAQAAPSPAVPGR